MNRIFVILFFIVFCFSQTFGETVKLHDNYYKGAYLNFSGDGQTQNVNEQLDNPFRVFVTDNNGNPLVNHHIKFEVYSSPSNAENYKPLKKTVLTDSLGIAKCFFTIGDKAGEYKIIVKSVDSPSSDILVYTVYGREKSWLFFMVIGLLGGLALFLFGLEIMSKGMQASAGDKMRHLIGKLTYNRFFALLSGIIITVMLSSSSAASVMLVGFVQAGLMSFVQSLGILLGAGIGTTITAQLIAMNIADYSLLIISVGFALMILAKSVKYNNIGKAIMGCGLLFFGMLIMSQSMYPLRSYDGFINFLVNLENPWIGILVGFIFTALIQSSAAFIGIMITLASQGFLSLEASIPLVLGTNLGTGVTAIIASLNSNREAKKVALAHTAFKAFGVLIFIWWIPDFADLLRKISGSSSDILTIENMAKDVPRQIANTHTVFSIAVAFILLPFTNVFAWFINKIIPPKVVTDEHEFELKHINLKTSSSPAIALSLAKKETERMSDNVMKMLKISLNPFLQRDKSVLPELQRLENKIDFLKENINKYLISISAENTDHERFNEAYQIMYVVKELEMIADILNTNIRSQANKWLLENAEFSDEGKEELKTIHLKSMKQLSRSMDVFSNLNLERAEEIKKKHKKYSLLAEQYEMHHYERLVQQHEKSLTSSKIHLELIGLYNAIIRHATNISRIFLNWSKEKTSEQ